jgi:predicted ATPase
LARLAAVIGQDFTFDLLIQASGLDEDALVRGLDELWQRRIIREHAAHAYDFSHDRIREVAYGEISPIRRRQWHRQIAQALETLHSDVPDSVCSQLAAHYEQAGATTQAVAYYRRAATAAQRVLAYTETVVHLNKLLGLLDSLPEKPESSEQKLDVLLLLGQMLIRVKGYTAAEVEATYNQARALCEHIDHVEKRFLALHGLWLYWGQRCRWQTAAEVEEAMLRLARQTQKPVHLRVALKDRGTALLHQGKFTAAHDYIQRAAALYVPKPYLAYMFDYEDNPGLLRTLCRLAETLWLLGYPDQAQARMDEALALARKWAQPFELLLALDFVLELAHNQRQQQAMQTLIEEYGTLTAKHPFPYHVATEMIYRGWLRAHTENVEAGIDLLKQGLEAWGKQGILMYLTYYRAWLVEAYGWANQVEQGLAFLAATLASAEETGEQFWSAELYRLKGELLLAQGSAAAEIETCFQQAIDLARRQDAKSLELRATVSLARLWQQGRSAEAHPILAEIYHWFTEGFDTADLQEAETLLAELAQSIALPSVG